ncbi:MAG: metal ABC transporter substrate-binding protein [Gemmatimonadetes bacterium]|nr:metal ABC transporter substrate-binding protein [Gemmatimonadota bacterium]
MNTPSILLVTLTLTLGSSLEVTGVRAQQMQRRHRVRGAETVRVVTTQPAYAALVREVGGPGVVVSSIAAPVEDPHFVRPKPSFAVDIRHADVFVTTGLDLELWAPMLLDRAGNADVMEGGPGYVTAYTGIRLLDIPVSTDRSAGDVHLFGNPHLHTDPLRALQIARNITRGLKSVAPERASDFDASLAELTERIHRRLFGDELVDLLGGETLENLALSNRLMSFLQTQQYDGGPLVRLVGGWLAEAEPFRGRQMICYHKNWSYFEERFDVHCADYIEPKPGIPPTPGHVAKLTDMMLNRGLRVLLAASYFDPRKVESVARRGNAVAVLVPLNPGVRGVDDYFDLMDLWVGRLADAFRSTAAITAHERHAEGG